MSPQFGLKIEIKIPEFHGLIKYVSSLGNIGNGRRWADKGVWGTKSALFGVNSNLI